MKRYVIACSVLAIVSIIIVTASSAKFTGGIVVSANKPISEQVCKENRSYVINTVINLSGDTLQIPKGCTLVFNGGVLRNGVVKGNHTGIRSKGKIFDNIAIEGTWLVPEISTEMFGDLSENNALRNVIALSDSSIQNTIHIESGKYWLRATSDEIAGLRVRSNSELIIDGEVQLRPNSLIRSYVLLVQDCKNVTIRGKGSIIGEKDQHLGRSGEWGMGIYIKNSSFVSIRDVSVSNCWGDCITLAVNCENILIDGCSLSNARRQGISITGKKNVEVRNCTIKDIHGTAPEYGIDIEPDANGEATNITISNCVVENSGGGYVAYGGADNVIVDNIVFKDCRVRNLIGKKPAFLFQHVQNCTVKGCVVTEVNTNCLRTDYVTNITVSDCKLDCGTSDRAIRCIESKGINIHHNELKAPRIAINNLSNATISNNTVYCRNITEKKASELTNVSMTNNVMK